MRNRKQKDIAGLKYNRLTAIKFSHREKDKLYWDFLCSCGNEKVLGKKDVTSGNSKSCGCLIKEAAVRNGIRRSNGNL